jgi:hypothetical protein
VHPHQCLERVVSTGWLKGLSRFGKSTIQRQCRGPARYNSGMEILTQGLWLIHESVGRQAVQAA